MTVGPDVMDAYLGNLNKNERSMKLEMQITGNIGLYYSEIAAD